MGSSGALGAQSLCRAPYHHIQHRQATTWDRSKASRQAPVHKVPYHYFRSAEVEPALRIGAPPRRRVARMAPEEPPSATAIAPPSRRLSAVFDRDTICSAGMGDVTCISANPCYSLFVACDMCRSIPRRQVRWNIRPFELKDWGAAVLHFRSSPSAACFETATTRRRNESYRHLPGPAMPQLAQTIAERLKPASRALLARISSPPCGGLFYYTLPSVRQALSPAEVF